MRAGGFIREVRLLVHDAEGLGYPDALLLEFINDGLCLIYQMRPEAFAASRVLPAKRGEVQCLDDCCERLISVDGVVDACGNPLANIRQGSVKSARAFDKAAQAGTPSYTFSIRDNVAKQFEIHPPVSHPENTFFRITCTRAPAPLQNADDQMPDCAHHEALLDYVLYRVYAVEADSISSQQLSVRYYQQCLQLLGIERAVAQEILEDNNNNAAYPPLRHNPPNA